SMSSSPPSEFASFPTRRSSDLGFAQRAGTGHFEGPPLGISFLVGDFHQQVRMRINPFDLRNFARQRDRFVEVELSLHRVVRQYRDRKSTRLNSSHEWISYAVFC